MNSIIYKRLFEIRILHDYYLMKAFAESSNTSFFTQPNQRDIINKILKWDQYDVANYFEIKPLEDTEKLLQNYNIKLINNQLGFFLGMEVGRKTVELPDNESIITYYPIRSVPANLHLQFSVNSVDYNLYKRAILPTQTTIDSKFYFTNFNASNGKLFPWLSEGSFGMVDAKDLNFLPFQISINTTAGKTINTQLSKVDGDLITEFEKMATSDSLVVDLRKREVTDTEKPPLEDGLYELKIEEDGTVIQEDKYFISEKYFRQNNFGVIDIFFNAENNNYDLLENQNELKTRVNIDSSDNRTVVKHPVYELRLKGNFS